MPVFDIYQELRSMVTALNSKGLDYALCGGLALAVHAEPRATKDIDLLIHPDDLDPFRVLLRALDYKFEALTMTFSSGLEVRRISKIEQAEVFTLDLVLVNDLLRETWETRVRVEWAEQHLWVVSRDGLIAMKRLAGRPQDLVDIQRLQGGEGG